MKEFIQLKVSDLKKQGAYTRSTSPNAVLDHNQDVMQGKWSYQLFGHGLSMHYVDMEEIEDVSFSSQIPAGISFNIVYQGDISFTLGDHHYNLKAQKPGQAVCSCYAIKQPEMLTRHTQKGMWVRKVNVFSEKKWLVDRTSNDEDLQKINQLFSTNGQLLTWQPSDQINQIVADLISIDNDIPYTQSLQIEAEILKLLSVLLTEIFENLKTPSQLDTAATTKDTEFFQQCKALLEHSMDEGLSLADIASNFNISISTLQRRFKASSGMTVAEYIRWLKLDKSKQQLIEGHLTIGEIAYEAGYNHTANFISSFKRQFTVSPAAYKKLHYRK